MSELKNPHDKFFKETFTQLEVARDFFANYLPETVTAVLDLDSLNLQPGSFIDIELQEQFADLLYVVNLVGSGSAYVYILMEHKSYYDPFTLFQLLRYLVSIWERDRREGKPLWPIIPVVVYHGRERWRVATNFNDLFEGPEALRPYWPSFQYDLQDLSVLSDEEVRGQAQLQIALLVMKYIFDPALHSRLGDILSLFDELAEAKTALESLRTVLYYVGKASTHLAPEEMVEVVQLALADKGSDMMQTVADYWIEQGIEQGIEKGIEKGRVKMLQEDVLDLLYVRLEQVTLKVEEQIANISDISILRQLHRTAATAVTMDAFVAKLTELTNTK